MPRRVVIICAIAFVPNLFSQQFTLRRLSVSNLTSVSFADSLHGWIGGVGTLSHTTDGGQTWTPDTVLNAGTALAVEAVSPNCAWLLSRESESSHIAKTTDQGLHWNTLLHWPSGGISHTLFTQLSARDSLHAWYAGQVGYLCACPPPIFSTSDGGTTLSNYRYIGLGGAGCLSYTGLKAYSDSIIAAIACRRILLLTDDDGTTWREDTLDRQYNDMAFVDSHTLWLVGDSGRVRRSSDFGVTWAQQTTPITAHLTALEAIDSHHAWAVGSDGTIIHTTDAGSTWTSFQTPTHVTLTGISFPDNNHGWIVGDSGIVLQYHDGTFTSIKEDSPLPPSPIRLGVHPNPFNPTTSISLHASSPVFVRLQCFDALGRLVSTLYEGELQAGERTFIWTPKLLASGTYFLRLFTDQSIQTVKVVLLQ